MYIDEAYEKKFIEWANSASRVLRSKEEIVEYSKNISKNWENEELRHYLSEPYIEKLVRIYDQFLCKLDELVLPPAVGSWAYALYANDWGITLYYKYYEDFSDESKVMFKEIQRHMILREPAKLLTLDEFAQIYSVDSNTVRQWIRRAKIKNAKKDGTGWKISELTDVSPYKMSDAYYGYYELPLEIDVDPKYEFIKGYSYLSFSEKVRGKERKIFLWRYVGADNKPESDAVSMTNAQAAEFEYYLISHSQIENREVMDDIEINGRVSWKY